MQDKKQIIGLILSVVLSVGLVVAGANAATTVGNNVSVGGTLAVTGTSTLTVGQTVGGDLTASMDLTVTATTTMNGDIVLGNATADNILTTGIFSTTTWAGGAIIGGDVSGILDLTAVGTSTFNGDILLGNAAADSILITGTPTITPTTTFSAGATFGGGVTVSLDVDVTGELTVTATTTLNGSVVIGNAADLAVGTATSTFAGDVSLGDTVADNIRVLGTISSATTSLLSIGGGQLIAKHLTGTGAINFGAIAANMCATGTIVVTGATAGDTVLLGVPSAFSLEHDAMSWSAYATTNLAIVRICNPTAGATPNFADATFRADVWQH